MLNAGHNEIGRNLCIGSATHKLKALAQGGCNDIRGKGGGNQVCTHEAKQWVSGWAHGYAHVQSIVLCLGERGVRISGTPNDERV